MTTDLTSRHEVQARHRFDDWSESQTFQRLRSWLSFVQEHVMARIDWANTENVLDVACGSGWAVYEAAHRLRKNGGGLSCGCDISEGMLRQRVGENHPAPNAYFLAASAQSLPYASDTFDAAICTIAFHHFPHPVEALVEIRRVLRPGGKLLIADTCRDQSMGTWIWDRMHRWFEKSHVMYYRTDELLDLLRAAGMEQVEVEEFYPSYKKTRKLIANFAVFSAQKPKGVEAAAARSLRKA